MKKIIGDDVECKPVWGLDEEGEICGVWRDLGIPNLWAMMGMSSDSVKVKPAAQ
jgi:hypothetical protein